MGVTARQLINTRNRMTPGPWMDATIANLMPLKMPNKNVASVAFV